MILPNLGKLELIVSNTQNLDFSLFLEGFDLVVSCVFFALYVLFRSLSYSPPNNVPSIHY